MIDFSELASANYPEILRKMYVVNAPWIFNTFFWGLKQLLPARYVHSTIIYDSFESTDNGVASCEHNRTLEKVSVMGASYQAQLHGDIPPASLPPHLGGAFSDQEHSSFEFDISDGGLLHCPLHVRFDVDQNATDSSEVSVDVEVTEVK